MKHKMLLDLGAYEGQTICRFQQTMKDAGSWNILSFEPHPKLFKRLQENFGQAKNIGLINAAVTGTDETTRTLYIGKENNGEGSTLVLGKTTGEVDYSNSIKVKAISLSRVIEASIKPEDYVILKMNIEGAEYEIMEHILSANLMKFFNQVYIQTHKNKLDPSKRSKYLDIEKRFFWKASECNVEVYSQDKDMPLFRDGIYNQPNSKGKVMKVAHFVEFGPNRCGLYGTSRDLIMAERETGIDAALIDVQVKKGKVTSRTNLKDGDLKIVSNEWATKADILVRHSVIPKCLEEIGIPIVMAVHGRPESTFLLEHRRIMSIFTQAYNRSEQQRYAAYFTFWKQYMFHNSTIVPEDKLFYVPAMVDLKHFCPMGKTHRFKGEPNILVIDMWRQDTTPYNVILASALFRKKYCPTAKIHIIGAQAKKSSMKTLLSTLKDSIGEVYPLVVTTDMCYRGADIVVTPHVIATRVIRESLACGTPVVAGEGSPYTQFTANPYDTEAYADAINRCWQYVKSTGKSEIKFATRRLAEMEFNPAQSGAAVKKVYETVLEREKTRWKSQDGMTRRCYDDYDKYLVHQKNKHVNQNSLKHYDLVNATELRSRLVKLPFVKKGMNALCLGARRGGEVKAFRRAGLFAVGIDIKPTEENQFVLYGDFHHLEYHDDSVDIVFTNSLDHVYRIRRFLREVKRVLKPGGYFIIEAWHHEKECTDKWACLHWTEDEQIIQLLEEYDFEFIQKKKIESIAFESQFCFRKVS